MYRSQPTGIYRANPRSISILVCGGMPQKGATMNRISVRKRLLTLLLAVCTAIPLVSVAAAAAGINYIERITVDYDMRDYAAGDVPQATASVTEGSCTVAYEYWRELYQKHEGGLWYSTGRYWYSDPDKMAALPEEKRITKFEAGGHYNYNIVLVSDRGSFIGGEETTVTVGDYEWGVPDRSTNLKIKEMSTKLYIYGIYAIDLPEDTITDISVVNVNLDLDPSKPVAFTARPDSGCADKFDITEECWESGSSDDIIKSTDDVSRAPIAGEEYYYSIVLTAKDGYVFSEDFSGDKNWIKDGSDVTFTLDGEQYRGKFFVGDGGKTLTAWEFMNSVLATEGDDIDIDTVNIENVKLDYAPGDAPVASATVAAADSDKYRIFGEWWETDDENTDVNSVDLRDQSYENNITAFESGKTYRYGLSIKAEQGYYFTSDTKLKINGVLYEYKRSDGDTVLENSEKITELRVCTTLTITHGRSVTAGDINGDGSINTADLVRLMKYIAGSDVAAYVPDVNGDGMVSVADLVRLMKFISGLDVELHPAYPASN